LCEERTRTFEPARVLTAETLKLERTLSNLVNRNYGLTSRALREWGLTSGQSSRARWL
jgi:hypothetical protein